MFKTWLWGGYGHDIRNFTCRKNTQNLSEQMLQDFSFNETITLVEISQHSHIMSKHASTIAKNMWKMQICLKVLLNTYIIIIYYGLKTSETIIFYSISLISVHSLSQNMSI